MTTSRRHRTRRAAVVGAALVVALASCGDDEDADPTPDSTTASPATTAAGSPAVPEACALVPTAGVAAATGLTLDDGVPGGDERRRVCTFRDDTAGVGITVGVEAGGRFDEKAEQSQRSLGVDGEDVESLGDRARFFFSDEDIPEGVGGVLVGVGDVTIDVTLQGLAEPELREASIGIAELAVGNL